MPKVSVHSLRECVLSAASRRGGLGRRAQSLRCPPSLLRQVLRVREGKAASAAHVLIWPTAAPLVRNSPRGWAPKTLPNPEVRVGRADKATPLRLLVCRRQTVNPARRSPSPARGGAVARKSGEEVVHRAGMVVPARLSRRPAPATTPTPTALHPADRIVVRDLGVHPRGEFRTSGAAVGQISTWAALAAFPTKRGGLSEQRGWTPRSPRETPKCRERRHSRAREAKGEPDARREAEGGRRE
jgi:hypothetical protein